MRCSIKCNSGKTWAPREGRVEQGLIRCQFAKSIFGQVTRHSISDVSPSESRYCKICSSYKT